ncbi:YraN family protein [Afifella sp. H1R]|uniref:YraN family protein n=1 Tax=unclassified Afifella TaxID=2624128 RepID=UPI001F454A27|nr:YraN family protein [Afifella sp. H1R]MCF1505087.1 YraN family protein [Afifella sp. H1R]
MSEKRRRAYRQGHMAEMAAALFLMMKGYRILARRYRTPLGEIDLIARRGRTVAFVEVKLRGERAAADWALTPRSERRIGAAASVWTSRHPAAMQFTQRFDLVLVSPFRLPRHLADAFRPPN